MTSPPISQVVKKPKQKTAFIVGYIGTEYHGLQAQKYVGSASSQDVDTVEDKLVESAVKAGLVSESNAVDIKKINWSRSSRTDKGVHSASVVLAAKFLRDVNKSCHEDVLAMNKFLPDDIRVLGACKVRGGFNPRRGQTFRRYEYVVPSQFIGDHFDLSVLNAFIGQHHFHNYTPRNREMKCKPDVNINDPLYEKLDHIQQRMLRFEWDSYYTRNISSFECDQIEIEGKPFHRFTIKGESFAYNQIRKIMGIVIAMSHGYYSKQFLEWSLQPPLGIPVPLASASPLLLTFAEKSFINFRNDIDDLGGLYEETFANIDAFKARIYTCIANTDMKADFDELLEFAEKYKDELEQNRGLIKKRYNEYLNASGYGKQRNPKVFELWKQELQDK